MIECGKKIGVKLGILALEIHSSIYIEE
jgi:hypothetical protein